jgi:hypothetical protein
MLLFVGHETGNEGEPREAFGSGSVSVSEGDAGTKGWAPEFDVAPGLREARTPQSGNRSEEASDNARTAP